jgi:hypothetical protein
VIPSSCELEKENLAWCVVGKSCSNFAMEVCSLEKMNDICDLLRNIQKKKLNQ